ncbi:hypothetical protein ABH942_001311 [Flavobacterium sp. 28YEA47A]|uniref:hypothetical protein n=1 Tax=Flavobacterium sp. 28YEA47A TaxID=3156276 RepID=UPI003519AEFF
MKRKQIKYQKNRLLRTTLAILLLFTVSFSHSYTNTVSQTFQSETLYSKSNKNSGRKIISYKRAVQFGFLDAKSVTNGLTTNFSIAHTIQAKVKTTQKHKEYCSFKSDIQFFRTKTISAHAEDIPIS